MNVKLAFQHNYFHLQTPENSLLSLQLDYMPGIQTTIVAIVTIIDRDEYKDFLPQGTEYKFIHDQLVIGSHQCKKISPIDNIILSSKSVGPLVGTPGCRFLWLPSLFTPTSS